MHPCRVIGGGIGGLTAALALARHDIPVTVHERAPELREIGAGLGIWPAPLRVFDRLGIGDSIRALSGPWDEAGLRRADGRFLVRYSTEQFARRLGEPTIGVHRGELQALLLSSLDDGVVQTDAECIGLDQHDEGVTVRFRDQRDCRRAGRRRRRRTAFRRAQDRVRRQTTARLPHRRLARDGRGTARLGLAPHHR